MNQQNNNWNVQTKHHADALAYCQVEVLPVMRSAADRVRASLRLARERRIGGGRALALSPGPSPTSGRGE